MRQSRCPSTNNLLFSVLVTTKQHRTADLRTGQRASISQALCPSIRSQFGRPHVFFATIWDPPTISCWTNIDNHNTHWDNFVKPKHRYFVSSAKRIFKIIFVVNNSSNETESLCIQLLTLYCFQFWSPSATCEGYFWMGGEKLVFPKSKKQSNGGIVDQ